MAPLVAANMSRSKENENENENEMKRMSRKQNQHHAMTKNISFNESEEEEEEEKEEDPNEESVLRQWERMHRPPAVMRAPKPLPGYLQAGGRSHPSRASLIVSGRNVSRRHSVVCARDAGCAAASFPLKADAGDGTRRRRSSSVWGRNETKWPGGRPRWSRLRSARDNPD